MKIILLSGGSGKRLWPLSNGTRSKQFIKLLPSPGGSRESMVQRVVRQLKECGLDGTITVATSASQRDVIINQLGDGIPVVTEPERRDTFPAIALACSYLAYEEQCPAEEIVVVMPCDPYTEQGYFETVRHMADAVGNDAAELVLMGIRPTYPSSKYGYVVPSASDKEAVIYKVSRFTEKPDVPAAERLISEGAFWNGGVFAFRLGYMTDIVSRYVNAGTFAEIRSRYVEFPKISFDYEVTDELKEHAIGNVILDRESENTHVVNELDLPVMCIGARNLVIAASCDGILVSEKSKSEHIKTYADRLQCRPMYEERRWGEYKVIDTVSLSDGHKTLTKQVRIKSGKDIGYQVHHHRDEVWTFIDGDGMLALDGKVTKIGRGDTVCIRKGMRHAVKAITDLLFIEVQSGDPLMEEDVERFDWNWES